jgi:hypothetical protein
VSEAARVWLTKFVDRYASRLDEGPGGEVHRVRELAQKALDRGPTDEDAEFICQAIAKALPESHDAAAECDSWRPEQRRHL